MAKTFVQGWVRTKSGGSEREPMRPEVLDAPDGVTAAKEYARRHGVRDQDWWNVGPSPRVVIRTEEV